MRNTPHLNKLKSVTFTNMLFTVAVSLLSIFPILSSHAGNNVDYTDGKTNLLGYWVNSKCSEQENDEANVVLIVHQWKGLGEYEKQRADMLAEECYDAFAIDMYGAGIRPKNPEEAGKQASLYKNDPILARQRLNAALSFAQKRKNIKTQNIAILGYCFGGTMALELARSGAPISAAISFHGSLSSKAPVTQPGIVHASIQIHHGADDPHVPASEVQSFMEEMNLAKADWSLTSYAHAVHSFTEKEAGNDPSKGAAYNEKADQRSWAAALSFLKETLHK